MYGSYMKCIREGLDFILGAPLGHQPYLRVKAKISGDLISPSWPLLKTLFSTMSHLYEPGDRISPFWSLLKALRAIHVSFPWNAGGSGFMVLVRTLGNPAYPPYHSEPNDLVSPSHKGMALCRHTISINMRKPF